MDADLSTCPRSASPFDDLEYFDRPPSPAHTDPGIRTRSNTPDADHDAPTSTSRSMKDRSGRSFVSRLLLLNDAVRATPTDDAVRPVGSSAARGQASLPQTATVGPTQGRGRGVAAERAQLLASNMAGIQAEIHKVEGAIEDGFRSLAASVERTGRVLVDGLMAVNELAGAIRESNEANKQLNENLLALTCNFEAWAFPPPLEPVEQPNNTDGAILAYNPSFSLPLDTAKYSMVLR
ncbi:hypothetical protein C8F01DRAFT_1253305 [Mycena amicta]|nr:hypothetical protein C8F01DRAFT_1253305 [Mycena amicta]